MSPGEFKKHYLGYVPPSDEAKAAQKQAKVPKYDGLATMVDWSDRYTTSINNQGYCGSCWAFSAVQQVESDSIRKGLLTNTQKLSVQQLVSCDTSGDVPYFMENYGCQGGNTETAFMYISYTGGVVSDSDYPYSSYYATTSTCTKSATNYQVTITGYHTVEGEASMKDYVMSTGPLAVCMDATDWASYKGGIVASCGTSVNHCVQVVGVDTQNGYWIVRNSWGTSWGMNGYIYLQTDRNICQIASDPHYVDPVAI
jgi:C1A family cysteine protease